MTFTENQVAAIRKQHAAFVMEHAQTDVTSRKPPCSSR
jgi:hypothetical protein